MNGMQTSQDLAHTVGDSFSTDRERTVISAVLESPPQLAAQIAQPFLEHNPGRIAIVLATLFSHHDLETAHAVLSISGFAWSVDLQSNVRQLVIMELQQVGTLPCIEQRQPSEVSLRLLDRYIDNGAAAFAQESVVLSSKDSEKFMLIEIGGELFFRAGGPRHYDIIMTTKRECVEAGCLKRSSTVTPRGGGFVELYQEGIRLDGASGDYGYPDYPRVKELILSRIPNLLVRIPQDD